MKLNFSITVPTQVAKAKINSLLALTAVHQHGQLQLASSLSRGDININMEQGQSDSFSIQPGQVQKKVY